MSSELRATIEWFNSALASVGATGVYRNIAPPGAVAPYVVVSFYGGSDVMGVAGHRIWANNAWLIEAWGLDADFAAVDAVALAVDTALHDKHSVGAPGGIGMIVSSVREQARLNSEEVGNQLWVRIGGVYRIQAQGS